MIDLMLKTSLGIKKYVIMDAGILADNQDTLTVDDHILATAYG